jgi:hypothetical protein
MFFLIYIRLNYSIIYYHLPIKSESVSFPKPQKQIDVENSKNCRLVGILKTFSREEFHNFEKIASSPYFSKGRNYRPYVSALKKYYPDFKGDIMYKSKARKAVFEKVHPGKPYNDQYMKNIFTDLIHLAEETLFQKVARKHNHQNLSSLAIEEAKRGLFPLANHNIQLLENKLLDNGVDEVYFYCKGINEIAYSILYNKSHGRNHETGKPFSTGIYFIYFSLITLALSIYNTSARRTMLNLEEEKHFNEIYSELIDLKKLEKLLTTTGDEYREVILIFLYYLIHKSDKAVFSNFEKMRTLLLRNYPRFNPRMLFYAVSLLLEVLFDCKDKIKDRKFRKEYHRIAEFSLKNGCYKIMKASVFQFNRYRAYYKNAFALGEIEWVRKFAEKYTQELPPSLREETAGIVNANILFENKLYDESLEALKVKCTNIFSKIDQRILKLKILYHKESFLHAEESLETFKKFVTVNKAAKNVFRSNFTLFIKYYKKLLNASEGSSDLGLILKELNTIPAFPEKRWLTENFEKPAN